MTENEAKKLIAKFCEDRMNFAIGKDMSDKELDDFCKFSDALNLSVSSLEEIQQYRAIGTVEEIKRMQGYSDLAKKHSTIGQVIDSCAEYEAIGTVEECREARERQRAKKPVKYGDTRQGLDNDGNSISWQEDCYDCPTCGSFLGYVGDCNDEQYQDGYCRNCGQAIDWSDNP